ncbi:hypothetical protein MJ_0415 [Methanocaldococcus jannaschii DSM 2661]|uniref:Uncharacterized protein MJ0415 n=1 Tax=Methanocaldococcus jannaschii (strain ATCC 43067 / DSM 2661 / JAL-1 / JCM 10045 / NBRC 100440) TaxID=243232 RepID=Y415_METJA|nr:RecName: Full=Uncharacterized protein MJ0415 [Methanocaldococcus jannaschii DSM 2661]AAB98406.1 hypothetical protein MJ_0415 [Methanocaldococcus jannaschii DSM 2661]
MKRLKLLGGVMLFAIVSLMVCGCMVVFPKKYPDVLYKEYDVIKIENRTINGVKTAIVYQVKTEIGARSSPYSLDADSKKDIGAITYYVFKNTDVDEVQIICYYAGGGGLQPYYKFKIKRRDAELSGLLNVSEKELPSATLYYIDKLISLGDLWINDRLPVNG